MGRMMVALLLALSPAASAAAIECGRWQELDAGAKAQAIQARFEEKLASGAASDYPGRNVAAVRRCFEPRVPEIVQDFDAACAEGISRDMDALDRIFSRYYASCTDLGNAPA